MKTFKKYQNRKIYSPDESKYVTVVDIAQASLTDDVKVTENVTGNDITNESLLAGFLKILGNESLDKLVALAKTLAPTDNLKTHSADDTATKTAEPTANVADWG